MNDRYSKASVSKQKSIHINEMFVRLLKIIKMVNLAHPVYFWGLTITIVLQGFLPALQLWVWKSLIDKTVLFLSTEYPSFWDDLWRTLGTLVLLYVVDALLSTFNNHGRQLLGENLQFNISALILDKANSLELPQFENHLYYDKLQNAFKESGYRPLDVYSQTMGLIQQFISLLSMITILSRLNWLIFPILAITLIPSIMTQKKYGSDFYELHKRRAPEIRKQQYISLILTTDWFIKEVRTLGIEAYLSAIFRDLYKKFYGQTKTILTRQTIASIFSLLFSICGWLISLAYAFYQIFNKAISVGELTLYTQAISQSQSLIQSIYRVIGGLFVSDLYIQNLFEFLDLNSEELDTGLVWDEEIHQIEFRNVSFRYNNGNELVLRDITFTAKKGEVLAIVGDNGAGKTTLIKLLCKLYKPCSGTILINNKSIAEYSPRSLQKYIAVIFQDYGKYHFTAQENIGIGDIGQVESLSAIETAAIKSGADQIIKNLQYNYKTNLGKWFENGQELSAGQWQKIALARVFFRNSSLLILDEPTSSVDALSEFMIFKRLTEEKADHLTILVSHRFSSVKMADQILVINGGQIIEKGSHHELLEKNGKYTYLFNLQAQSFQ